MGRSRESGWGKMKQMNVYLNGQPSKSTRAETVRCSLSVSIIQDA